MFLLITITTFIIGGIGAGISALVINSRNRIKNFDQRTNTYLDKDFNRRDIDTNEKRYFDFNNENELIMRDSNYQVVGNVTLDRKREEYLKEYEDEKVRYYHSLTNLRDKTAYVDKVTGKNVVIKNIMSPGYHYVYDEDEKIIDFVVVNDKINFELEKRIWKEIYMYNTMRGFRN